MKKEITIEIPDNLTEQEEQMFIAKKLMKSAISGPKTPKKIGEQRNFDSFKYPETSIRIVRVTKEKISKTLSCHCGALFQQSAGTKYYTNIGGVTKTKHCCSLSCAELVVSLSPSRISLKKTPISRFF